MILSDHVTSGPPFPYCCVIYAGNARVADYCVNYSIKSADCAESNQHLNKKNVGAE